MGNPVQSYYRRSIFRTLKSSGSASTKGKKKNKNKKRIRLIKCVKKIYIYYRQKKYPGRPSSVLQQITVKN